MLGKLPVLGRPTNLDYRRARAYCTCSRCGWGCLDMFSLIYHFSFKPKPTNQLESQGKNLIAADLGYFREIFFFLLKWFVLCSH